MVESNNLLTATEILLESDILRTIITAYIFLYPILVLSFLNIYSVDKREFLNHTQNCIYFKRKMFFVITYSKEKRIVSKKTFIMELIGYFLSLAIIAVLLCSLKQTVKTACILLGVVYLVVFAFGCVTGWTYWKTKKYR